MWNAEQAHKKVSVKVDVVLTFVYRSFQVMSYACAGLRPDNIGGYYYCLRQRNI